MALICTVVALLFCYWLMGFRLEVSDGWLKYRDGHYKLYMTPITDINNIESKYIEVKYINRTIAIPRLAVISKGGKTLFIINSKPFGRNDINEIRKAIGI